MTNETTVRTKLMTKPLLFTPVTIRGVTLPNRIVVSPMAQYSARDGFPVAHHLVHYGKFALGGAGLVIMEETAVTRGGRITNGCLGLWTDDHAQALRPIVEYLKANGSVPAVQLGHGGRKSSSQRPWHGNGPLTRADIERGDEEWRPMGPSPLPLSEGWQTPQEMTRTDMDIVRDAFAAGARRALAAGFEVLEIHMAHGYLLQSFLSPLSNVRTDGYGTSLQGRIRFPLEVVEAVRAAIPESVPLFTRISAVDWIDGGWEMDDSVAFARELKARGVDVVDCSSGGNSPKGATNANLTRAPGYQAPFAERIRRETGIMTQAVGFIRTGTFAEELLQKGSADLIAVGRQFLYDPFWGLHAAEELGLTGEFEGWPQQYAWWLEKWAKGLKAMGQPLQR